MTKKTLFKKEFFEDIKTDPNFILVALGTKMSSIEGNDYTMYDSDGKPVNTYSSEHEKEPYLVTNNKVEDMGSLQDKIAKELMKIDNGKTIAIVISIDDPK